MTATSSYTPTGDASLDGVLTGIKWGVMSLTYSFPTDASFYGTPYGSGEPTNGFEAFTATQQAGVRNALANYAAVANLTFTEVTESATTHGDLRYSETDAVGTAWAYYPSTSAIGGDAWFNNSKNLYETPISGNYAFLTMLHETGHTLGLKHPQDVMGAFGTMPLDHDSLEYTVMSYRSYVGGPTTGYTNSSSSFPQSLMMYDIAAVQQLYGANYNTNSGDTVYKWSTTTGEMSINGVGQGALAGNKIFRTIWDGGGNDTYDFSNYATNLNVDLNPGGWSTVSASQLALLGSVNGTIKYAVGNIANALLYQGNTASLIENAIGGSGADTITGNMANNKLTGGVGNDILNGGAGSDTAVYLGLSIFYSWVQNADGSWTVTDLGSGRNEGNDTLYNIENLVFSDTTVALSKIDRAPIAVNDAATTGQGIAVTVAVLANDSDPDGDVLSIAGTPGAVHGTVSVNSDGTLTYTPDATWSGVDTISYSATDGLLSAGAQVAVTVAPTVAATINHAPVAVDDTATTKEDTAVTIAVLANDSDPDGNALSIAGTPSALHGAVTVDVDGTLRYAPNANWNGTDTISYTISDGALTDVGLAIVTVSAVNDAPIAVNDTYATAKSTKLTVSTVSGGVLGNDNDVEGSALTAVLVGKPSHGTLTLNSNGTFTYTPQKNYVGTDTFTYKASDGVTTTQAAVTIKVGTSAGNDVFDANDQAPAWQPWDQHFDSGHHAHWSDVHDHGLWAV